MKNIHVLPTEKFSNLILQTNGELRLSELELRGQVGNGFTQHIYITSDEEIKVGDWFAVELFKITGELRGLHIEKCIKLNDIWCNDFDVVSTRHKGNCNKIILTDNKDLIKDGVQVIDDEFLEWFVKNPSCEYVKVTEHLDAGFSYGYKIIFPKEESKLQCKDCNDNLTDCTCIEDTIDMKQTPGKETADYIDRHIVEAMVEVAKQNLYSEVFQWLASRDYLSDKVDIIQKEFEQFKKK